jgi:hypothetical protein
VTDSTCCTYPPPNVRGAAAAAAAAVGAGVAGILNPNPVLAGAAAVDPAKSQLQK